MPIPRRAEQTEASHVLCGCLRVKYVVGNSSKSNPDLASKSHEEDFSEGFQDCPSLDANSRFLVQANLKIPAVDALFRYASIYTLLLETKQILRLKKLWVLSDIIPKGVKEVTGLIYLSFMDETEEA